MINEVEDRSLEEPLVAEGTEDEFCEFTKSKIKYTRALLLEFTEAEVCRKLPRDFDLLILRELDGASDGTIEHKRISGKPSVCGSLPSSRWDLGFPGERWDNNLLMRSKGSNWRGNCSSERSEAVSQQVPQESGYNAGILSPKIPESDPYQLRKTGNPYRPPHCDKKMQETQGTSELGVEFSGSSSFPAMESDQRERGSVDSITENDKSGYWFPLVGVDNSMKKPLGECEATWRNSEGSGKVGATNKFELGIIEDNQVIFDEFWAEILEILDLQLEPKRTPTPTRDSSPDSEVEICFPDEDRLISVDRSTIPENLNLVASDNSNGIADSEAEINLPDEDSLISIHDLIGPYRTIPTLDKKSGEADKLASNTPVNIRKNSESLNFTKWDNRSTTFGCNAPSFLDFSASATHRKLHPWPSYSQTSTVIFGPEKPSSCLENDHMNLEKFMTPKIIPYIPTLNGFSCSNFHHRPFHDTILTKTKTNDSLVQYSLFQQPNIFPQHQNHLLLDTSCPNPIKQVATPEVNAMQFLQWTLQQPTREGFGK